MLERLKKEVTMDWAWRTYRKLALVSGIGAAGLLAYRMYYGASNPVSTDPSSWRLWWITQSCSFLPTSWLRYLSQEQLNGRASQENDQDAQRIESERLEHYFRVTVAKADVYNNDMLELVQDRLLQDDQLDQVIHMLTSEDPDNQEELSNQVKAISFTRFIVALWTVPTSFLLCRLMFCIFGRIIYLSMAIENINERREHAFQEREPRPPIFDQSYQRRLLNTFKEIIPDTISRHMYRLVHQVVKKHVDPIGCADIRSLPAVNMLLSAINSEIEAKMSADQGMMWQALLGDTALVRSLDMNACAQEHREHRPYVEDIFSEARRHVATRSWNVNVVNAVKVFVQRQTGFLNNAYESVVREYTVYDGEGDAVSTDDDSCEDDGTDIFETGSAYHRASREDEETVVYNDDAESETSDKSAYDVSHYSPDPRMTPIQDRSRLVAEGSLEPIEYDAEVAGGTSCEPEFLQDGEDSKGKVWDAANDSEMDTGEHHSFDDTPSPVAGKRGISDSAHLGSMANPKQRTVVSTTPDPTQGIVFFRWATKLGRQGAHLLQEPAETTKVHNNHPI